MDDQKYTFKKDRRGGGGFGLLNPLSISQENRPFTG